MPRGFARNSVRKFAGRAGPSAADTCPDRRRIAAMKAPRRRPPNTAMTNLPWQDAEKHLNVCHPKPHSLRSGQALRCQSEPSEESLCFAQGKLREGSESFLFFNA